MIDEKRLKYDLMAKTHKERFEDCKTGAKGIYYLSDDINECIDSQPKIGGWISCSERLPEIEQTVLLSLRSLDVSVGFRANTDGYFYTEGEGYVLYENVLAWLPLLEAYHE